MKKLHWKVEIWPWTGEKEIYYFDCEKFDYFEVHKLAEKRMEQMRGDDFLVSKVFKEVEK